MSAAYVPTSFTDITRTLAGMFSEFEGADAKPERENYLRAAHCNSVFLLSSPREASIADDIIEKLAVIHPSRFFVLVINAEASQPRAEVSAQCHLIPGAPGEKIEHLCSEVIRIHFRAEDLWKIPSILRSYFVTGASVEVFLSDAAIPAQVAEVILSLADQVYLNSATLEKDLALLGMTAQAGIPIVDTQWLATSAWRDQVRTVFEAAALPGLARGVSKIEISYVAPSKTDKPFLPYLLAGWFVDRLGLEVVANSGAAFDCQAPHGGSVRLSLIQQESGDTKGRQGVGASFLSSVVIVGIVRGGKEAQIRIERKVSGTREAHLDTTVRVESPFRFSRALDEEAESAVLTRFFMIGDSIANYRAALSWGLRLNRLQKNQ